MGSKFLGCLYFAYFSNIVMDEPDFILNLNLQAYRFLPVNSVNPD